MDRPSDTRLLRQLSLDLLGRIPAETEYEAVLDGQRPEELVAAMMESDDFHAMLRDYHRGLLWSYVDPSELSSRELAETRVGSSRVWLDGNAARIYRGSGQVSCIDIEHTSFDAEGHALPLVENYLGGRVLDRPAPNNSERCAGVTGGCRLDGWVRVRPFWAPGEEIRVCAFDAQTAATGLGRAERDCVAGARDQGCGCGPSLERCVARDGAGVADRIAASLEEEPLRIFERVVRDPSASYFDALTTRTTEIDGALSHYYHHAAMDVSHDESMASVPEIDWSETEFESFERGPEHSGVFTTQSFLTRFASHRARANRFSTAFLCEPFQALSDGLPPSDDPCSQNPDLSVRCGCASCHVRLEPLAVHFGRWDIQGNFGYFGPDEHPVFDDGCATCAAGECSARCDAYYVTRTVSGPAEEGNLGMLSVLAWRSDAERAALDRGPAALIEEPSVRDRMAYCSARTLAERFLHRELSADELATWVPSLGASFRSGGERLQVLVEAIVRDPRYLATH